MGQLIQVNGDYNIKTGESATITLDTGPGVGEVIITGNLRVSGDFITVDVSELEIEDNVILLNKGETGAGVTLQYAGFEIERGTEVNVSFLWDENDNTWNLRDSSVAPFEDNSNLRLRKLLTNPDTDFGDLSFDLGNVGVLKIIDSAGTYSLRVTDDNDIPNKEYVDNAIQTNPTFQILRDTTRTVAFDIDDPVDSGLFPIGPYFTQPTRSLVAVVVDDNIIAEFSSNDATFAGLRFLEESATYEPGDPLKPNAVVIQTVDSSANIKLETNGTGKVEITYGIQFDSVFAGTWGRPGFDQVAPASVSEATVMYGGAPEAGTTGVYFANDDHRGELVSKKRALLFSMLF
jgi:hypothetical protein